MIAADSNISIWIVGFLFFGLGLVFGCMAAYLMIGRQSRNRELQEELITLREKFSDYRDQVSQHFMRTSELVQEMTLSYRAVYEHLASGAQNLCSEESDTPQVNLPEKPASPEYGDNGMVLVSEQVDSSDRADELLGDAPRISDLDIQKKYEDDVRIQH